MPDNRLVPVFPKHQDGVIKAITKIREKLPFLIDLTTEDRSILENRGCLWVSPRSGNWDLCKRFSVLPEYG